jgi:hypothetical protein
MSDALSRMRTANVCEYRLWKNNKLPKRGKGQREEEARRPPNDLTLKVAGSTEATVCESIGITRIQPTPKSFRVDAGDKLQW